MKNNKGFTLIELLIVISIIGLLASIVFVGLRDVRSQGRDARRVADLRNVQNALEVYFTRIGTYPPAPGYVALQGEINLVLSSEIPNDPLCPGGACPAGGTQIDYQYATDPNNLSYVLAAMLENIDASALNGDPDSTIYGIDCTDPIYCVQF